MEKETRKPLYHVIQEYVQELIAAGILKPNEKLPSDKEFMERFQVSRITVSTALTNLAKDGLIYRVPSRGSFVSDLSNIKKQGDSVPQRGLVMDESDNKESNSSVSSDSRTIGLIVPNIDSLFAMRIVESIHQVLIANGYSITIRLTGNSKQQEVLAIRELIRMGAEGLIIFPVDEDTYNDEILSLKLQAYPFVLIDRYLPGVETHLVCSDNILGARLAVSHLWELGHRDIAVCSSIELPTVTIKDRIDGYMKELTARGAMINPALFLTDIQIHTNPLEDNHPFYRYIRSNQATAYVALHSSIAVLIRKSAQAIGLSVPEDISIVAFDNPTSIYDEYSYFTYIAQSEEVMGSRAAQVVLDIIKHRSDSAQPPFQKIMLEPKLKVYQSTGPLLPKYRN